MKRTDETKKIGLKKKYVVYFNKFFKNIKDKFSNSTRFNKLDELTSGELAVRDAINSLPCPIRVLRLKIDKNKYKTAKSDTYHLVRYNFSKLGEFKVKYYGEINLDEIKMFSDVLKDFDLNKERIEELKTFQILSYFDYDPWFWLDIIPYNILIKFQEHVKEFIGEFQLKFIDIILQKFEKKIDYNTKFGLKCDPIIPFSDLLKKDETLNIFGINTIEDLQKDIGEIQLIPAVPKEVKYVFNAAKRLYIFGYFKYYFFTISEHYALLALESALRNKYIEIYGKPKNYISLNKIIKKLVRKGIISKGNAKIYDAGRELRNALSHLTHPSIYMPNSRSLENTAYQINQLFNKEMN